jgi:hypothetical protein
MPPSSFTTHYGGSLPGHLPICFCGSPLLKTTRIKKALKNLLKEVVTTISAEPRKEAGGRIG